jgi:hypothetical protein
MDSSFFLGTPVPGEISFIVSMIKPIKKLIKIKKF